MHENTLGEGVRASFMQSQVPWSAGMLPDVRIPAADVLGIGELRCSYYVMTADCGWSFQRYQELRLWLVPTKLSCTRTAAMSPTGAWVPVHCRIQSLPSHLHCLRRYTCSMDSAHKCRGTAHALCHPTPERHPCLVRFIWLSWRRVIFTVGWKQSYAAFQAGGWPLLQ
jgi:hypothetical protein